MGRDRRVKCAHHLGIFTDKMEYPSAFICARNAEMKKSPRGVGDRCSEFKLNHLVPTGVDSFRTTNQCSCKLKRKLERGGGKA